MSDGRTMKSAGGHVREMTGGTVRRDGRQLVTEKERGTKRGYGTVVRKSRNVDLVLS